MTIAISIAEPDTPAAHRGRGRPKIAANGPDPIDVHVGSRLRQRRTLAGMSQQAVGDRVGLTFQQIQKYERGTNRIGASRLYRLAQALEVPVAYFFEGLPGSGTDADNSAADPLHSRETLELARAYHRIPKRQIRRRIGDLVRAMAETGLEE